MLMEASWVSDLTNAVKRGAEDGHASDPVRQVY